MREFWQLLQEMWCCSCFYIRKYYVIPELQKLMFAQRSSGFWSTLLSQVWGWFTWKTWGFSRKLAIWMVSPQDLDIKIPGGSLCPEWRSLGSGFLKQVNWFFCMKTGQGVLKYLDRCSEEAPWLLLSFYNCLMEKEAAFLSLAQDWASCIQGPASLFLTKLWIYILWA